MEKETFIAENMSSSHQWHEIETLYKFLKGEAIEEKELERIKIAYGHDGYIDKVLIANSLIYLETQAFRNALSDYYFHKGFVKTEDWNINGEIIDYCNERVIAAFEDLLYSENCNDRVYSFGVESYPTGYRMITSYINVKFYMSPDEKIIEIKLPLPLESMGKTEEEMIKYISRQILDQGFLKLH